jgi:beta-N-acetylhexosaminidase
MKESLSSLSIRQKVGQLFFIGIGGAELDSETRLLLNEVSPGGICLFARNIKEAAQTRKLLDGLREYLPGEPFLSIDQEGGPVDRLRRIMAPMPAANKLETAADAGELGTIIAETLRTLGFNMDFAPVVDVIDAERAKHANGLFSREFGRTKEQVVEMAGAFLRSLQDGGILGCIKHFPGLGAAAVDSHEELPEVAISEDELLSTDLFPYCELLAAASIGSVMVAHAAYPNVALQETGQNGKLLPASLSNNIVTGLLRDRLAFDGLVITDDLEMGAIVNNYGVGEACKMAFLAGVDMLAICADPNAVGEGFGAVLKAVESGEIGMERLEKSLGRIAEAKNKLENPLPFDIGRLLQLSQKVADLRSRLDS